MFTRDKTAGRIKQKVASAKKQVDKAANEAEKVLTLADASVYESVAEVTDLKQALADAEAGEIEAKEDFNLVEKVTRITLSKQIKVYNLISQFDEDLDVLLAED